MERDRYDSLDEGMERTVDIYTKVLLKILSTKKFTVSRLIASHGTFNCLLFSDSVWSDTYFEHCQRQNSSDLYSSNCPGS